LGAQPSLLGSLDDAELSRIKRVLIAAQVRNMQVILSPHNFGRYYLCGMETLIGTADVPIKAFADFSGKVASAFARNHACTRLA
jgi:endoglucanase